MHPSLLGLDALMVGRSHIVGNPLSQMLLNENATVTVAHTHTRHLPDLCRRAEILCVAIGCAEFIRGDWIKPGATVIDVGINRVTRDGKSRIVGDVNFAEAVKVAGAITPVPGGVGPMTIVCLLVNTLRAACMQAGLAGAGGVTRSAIPAEGDLIEHAGAEFFGERATALPPSAR